MPWDLITDNNYIWKFGKTLKVLGYLSHMTETLKGKGAGSGSGHKKLRQ